MVELILRFLVDCLNVHSFIRGNDVGYHDERVEGSGARKHWGIRGLGGGRIRTS